MTETANDTERRVEDDLKAMALDVERRTSRSTNVGCLGGVAAMVACFWFGGVWVGLGGGLVLAFSAVMVSTVWDDWFIKRVAKRFHVRYPEGGGERPVAMTVLAELESKGKSLDKLRTAIRNPGDSGMITRRRSEAIAAPKTLTPPVELLPVDAPTKPRATKGAAPVIPLEPFDSPSTPEAPDERDPGTRRRH